MTETSGAGLEFELLRSDTSGRRVRDALRELFAGAEPMRGSDLPFPVQPWNAARNWTNKGRLLPLRHVAKRVTPIAPLLVLIATVVWAI